MAQTLPHRKPLPEHLQVPWKVWQALVVFAAAWLLIPFLLVAELVFIAPAFHPAKAILDAYQNGNIYVSFGLSMVSALAALALVYFYLKRYGLSWAATGWRRFKPWQAVGAFLLVLGTFVLAVAVVFALVSALVPGFNANQPQTNDFTGSAGQAHPAIALWALVIIPPIIEETYFRGFLFPALSGRLGLIGGTLVTSLLFALAHLQSNVIVYTFVLSLALCYLYYRLKSIVPGIFLHMLNNYLAYLALVHK